MNRAERLQQMWDRRFEKFGKCRECNFPSQDDKGWCSVHWRKEQER